MTSIFTRLRTAAVKRSRYRETVAELSRLPIDVALDLDIDQSDVRRIAHRAVYGAH
ncbi:MAG: hypothetical protein AAF667_05300 [Pseudomonadota bacterium]